MNKPVAVDRKHTISGIDNFHVELFERLKEGTTLYTHPVKEQKCIVKDCENHKHEGGFVGDLCKPCHQFITTGEGIYSQAYRNSNPVKELTDEVIYEVWWQSDVASNYYRDSKEFGIEFAKAILRKAQAACNGFCGEYECKENQSICKRKAQEK